MQSKNKYFTIKEFQETYHIVYETARKDLMGLVNNGYITIKRDKKKFLFVFIKENQDQINSKLGNK